MSVFNTLTIAAINKETPTAVSVSFNVPSQLTEQYQFIAGQYVTLKTVLDGKEVRRAYSLCVAPASGQLTVLVKKVQDGVFSTYVNEHSKVGDTLEVGVPEGRFTFIPELNSQKTHMAFAAGSGITPVISILETVLNQEQNSKFILIYGNQSKEETIFFDRLSALKDKFPKRFSLELVFSRFGFQDYRVGRIDSGLCNYYVGNTYAKETISDFYICGPGAMIDSVSETLTKQGVAQENIHFERFTAATDHAKAALAPTNGSATVTYIVDDQTTVLEAPTKKSILETAMENDLDPPYSCQGGICSSCIARITEGTAQMRQNQILTESEVAEGLILTCQAHATSATLTVDYDDV